MNKYLLNIKSCHCTYVLEDANGQQYEVRFVQQDGTTRYHVTVLMDGKTTGTFLSITNTRESALFYATETILP